MAKVSAGRRTDQQPQHEGGKGDDDDCRYEVGGDPIGEPLYRRSRPLGVLDEANNLGQRRVVAHAGDPEEEGTLLVERGAERLVSG